MKRKRSLRQVLARQWMVFGLVLLLSFATLSVLLLFLLEDSLINRHLRDVAAEAMTASEQFPVLPPGFERISACCIPETLQARTNGLRTGGIREFRLPDGRYVHVLAGRYDGDRADLLVYDVSDQLTVNAALMRGWPWLLLAAAILTIIAYALAHRLISKVSTQALTLVSRAGDANGPEDLRELARNEHIEEFSELARLNAEVWEARLADLDRERETLAFLGHELRTPLQSIRNSLALLQDDRDNQSAWHRLHRAQNRLVRASHSVLWLASHTEPPTGAYCTVAPLLSVLEQEFTPLADARSQSIRVNVPMDLRWPLPEEVVETVLANLLLNAIQHGGPGDITVMASHNTLILGNVLPEQTAPTGFGLGLQLSRRLLERFGWSLTLLQSNGHTQLRLSSNA